MCLFSIIYQYNQLCTNGMIHTNSLKEPFKDFSNPLKKKKIHNSSRLRIEMKLLLKGKDFIITVIN